MAEKKRGVGAAEGVARADHAIRVIRWERIDCDVRLKSWRRTADRSRRTAGANRLTRQRQFDQSAAPERVAKAALPGHKWRIGERIRKRCAFQSARFERPGAVSLEPHAVAIRYVLHRRETRGEAGAVRAVRREVVHLIMQALRFDHE